MYVFFIVFISYHIISLFLQYYINNLEDNITEECNSNTFNTSTSHSDISTLSVSYNDLQISPVNETVSEQISQSIIQYRFYYVVCKKTSKKRFGSIIIL